MKFYKFWGRGQATVQRPDGSMVIDCYGHSDTSLEDAIENAARIAERTAAAVRAGAPPRDYGYANRPLREEVLEEHTIDGQLRAVITRNAYGARVLATDLLERLAADPLYMRMCTAQQCFRARVSPKHWRCEAPAPPFRFPWFEDEHEQVYRRWQESYEHIAGGYSTCAFVGAFGNADVDPAIEPIVAVHDKYACRGDLPLA